MSIREVGQDLGAQVVAHQDVVAAERERVARRAAPVGGEPGEVEAGRPALGLLEQVVDLVGGELGAGRAQQLLGLAAIHRQVVAADLDDVAVGPQHRDGEREAGVREP